MGGEWEGKGRGRGIGEDEEREGREGAMRRDKNSGRGNWREFEGDGSKMHTYEELHRTT